MNGQERTRWLQEQEQRYVWNPLQKYLGPTGIPQRLRGALGIASMMDPVQGITGSMAAADRGDYGEAAIGTVAAAAPIGIAALGRRFAVLATRAATAGAYDDAARALEETLSGTTAFSQALPAPAPTAADDLAAQVDQLEAPPATTQLADDFEDLDPRIEDLMELDQMYTLLGPRPLEEMNLLETMGQDVAGQRERFLDLLGRRETGWYDDLLSEDQLRSDLRTMVEDEVYGLLHREALEAQGVDPDDIEAILARYRDLRDRFPDEVENVRNAGDEWVMDAEDEWINIEPDEPTDGFDQPTGPAADTFDYYSGPLRHSPEAGIAGLYLGASRAARQLKQPTYSSTAQLRAELEARGARGKELDWTMQAVEPLFKGPRQARIEDIKSIIDVNDVFGWAPEDLSRPSREELEAELRSLQQANSPEKLRVSAADIQRALDEAPSFSITRTPRFADYGPPGGEGYQSTYFTHPSVSKGPRAAYEHFADPGNYGAPEPPPLLHTRAANYSITTPDGSPAKTHHVLEIQSDWAQHRQRLPVTPEELAQLEEEMRGLEETASFGEANPEELTRLWEVEKIIREGMLRSDFDARYPAPLIKNEDDWVDAGVRQNLLDAVNGDAEWVTFGNGLQAHRHVGMPVEAAKRFYERQVPRSVERVLKKFAREAGLEAPRLEKLPFVDGQEVLGFRITPEFRSAMVKVGLPAFRDGGMVFATPEGRRRGSVLPATWPKGMTGAEAIMSGQADFALPGFITEPVNSIAEALMTLDRIRRGEDVSEAEINTAGMTLGTATAAPALRGRGAPNVLSAGGSGPKKPTLPAMPEDIARIGASRPAGSVVFGSKKAPDAGKVKTVAPAPEGFVPKTPQTIDVTSGEGRPKAAREREILELRKNALPPAAGTEKAPFAARVAAAEEKMAVPTTFKLVSAPEAAREVTRTQGTAAYSPRAGEVLPGNRTPTRTSAQLKVSTDPGPQYLEVPMSALERIGLNLRHLTDPETRVSSDGNTVYLATGQDQSRFLRVWKDQSRWFGLPEQPKITTQQGLHRPLLETTNLAQLRASDVPKKPLGGR